MRCLGRGLKDIGYRKTAGTTRDVFYVAIRRKNEDSGSGKDTDLFGICACCFSGGAVTVRQCVFDVTDDAAWLKGLLRKLNHVKVDPIHLHDIVEDELYALHGSA